MTKNILLSLVFFIGGFFLCVAFKFSELGSSQENSFSPVTIAIDSSKDFESLRRFEKAETIFFVNANFQESERLPKFSADVRKIFFIECILSLATLESLEDSPHVSEITFWDCHVEGLNETQVVFQKSKLQRYRIEINECRTNVGKPISALLSTGDYKQIELKNLGENVAQADISSTPNLLHLVIVDCHNLSFEQWDLEKPMNAMLFYNSTLECSDVKKIVKSNSALILFSRCAAINKNHKSEDRLIGNPSSNGEIQLFDSPEILKCLEQK